MTDTEGIGQNHVVDVGFLRLVPDENVVDTDNVIDISDIGEVGNHYGQSGTPHWIRADVLREGVVNIDAIGEVGNWFGVSIADYTHPTSEP
jgi:hypothetical protein